MRKKIPTITRLDPVYAASLRPAAEEDPGRGEARLVEAMQEPANVKAIVTVENSVPAPNTHPPSAPAPHARQEIAAGITPPVVASPPLTRPNAATRKIDIRVNALERQEEALIDCGVDPAHVIRAALRRAVKNWQLGTDFVPPYEDQRTRITDWRARTSLAVDAKALAALMRTHDPLDVLSKWTLIRGQLEPRVWAEIDGLLKEIGKPEDQDFAVQIF